ncbi:MAG: OmpA family protein [Bacteroidia bacterium]|nr:OmpA family protein [Bacteroidia bacterium]
MKKTFNYLAFLSLILGLTFTSCVSSKKFKASEATVSELQQENAKKLSQLNDCNAKVKDLNDQKTSLLNENTLVTNDLKALSTESKMTIADQAKRLKRLQDMIQSQRDVMAKLKNSIADALMNYKTDELSVYIKDGNVYVSLAEKLLFKSGSDVVDPKGKEALKTLAQVLNSTKDITVMIEGHTDNVPIKTKLFKDNWDLSTARATTIVRILTKENGFDSNRINASGRGEFHPVQTNETVEGRAGNRRTEIILSPDMKELYKLLYQ